MEASGRAGLRTIAAFEAAKGLLALAAGFGLLALPAARLACDGARADRAPAPQRGEAYGLWRERRWAEWLAATSGAIYVPFEIYELTRGVSPIKLAMLALNVAIVLYMVAALRRRAGGIL
jgi:uncharacterized membrane protein (DUF2068 family)